LQHQNIALREEVRKASMFEEIVGSSAALIELLARVSTVQPHRRFSELRMVNDLRWAGDVPVDA
jgi:hypothetical protein